MPRPFDMLHVVAYDAPSDKKGNRRRARLAKFLEGRGIRVQGSVFELEMSPEKMPELVAGIREIIDEKNDSVRIYPLCAACKSRFWRLGTEAPVEDQGIVVW